MATHSRLQAQTAAQMAILSSMEEENNTDDEMQNNAEHRTVSTVLRNYLEKFGKRYTNEDQRHFEKVLGIMDKSSGNDGASNDLADTMNANEIEEDSALPLITAEVTDNGEGDFEQDDGIEMTNMNTPFVGNMDNMMRYKSSQL